jgi:phosphoribosyl-ATP pyrophosphohydrolase/phosphoribosyl-AMP cyclohydrolase
VSTRAADVLERVRFGADGLVPAVVQDDTTGRVLTVAYMSRESLERTVAEGETWFWSRSRGELWHKGATSGNVQKVRSISLDCDQDAVLVRVDQVGVACHTGAESCFHVPVGEDSAGEEPFALLGDLERMTAERAQADPESSYTARLLGGSVDSAAKKVGEEATEVAIAAKGDEHERLVSESADLLYHLAVVWRRQGVGLAEVAAELAARRRPSAR